MPGITTVSFDGDATLWDFEQVMRRSLGIVLAELRRRIGPEPVRALSVDRMIAIRNEVAAALAPRTVNLEEIRFQAFRHTLAAIECRDDQLAADLNALYMRHRFQDIELYADVVPALDALAPRYALGLLSNGNGYPDRCGLPGRFSFVVLSQEAGVAKPDPRIFQIACDRAGCRPCELLHVGDSLESDVAGANAAGAVSVWLNRAGGPRRGSVLPHHEITVLDQLPDLLAGYR